MRFEKWARLLILVLPMATGCAGFWDPATSSSSGGCTTNCSTATGGDFYILNAGSSPAIVGNSIVSGKLTGVSGSPWSVPSTPYAMAMSPNGAHLYVSTIAGVYVYPVTGGSLGSYAQVSQDATALALQVDNSGSWLIEAQQATGGVTMAAVPLNSSGGDNGAEQTATYSITNASVQTGKIAIAADNKFIFVALGTGGAIAVPFNSGVSTTTNPFSSTAYTIPVVKSGGSALSVGVDPSSRLFYVGESLADSAGTSGGLLAYNYSTLGGALTQATGSPVATGGLAPNSILPNADGSYVYVASGQGTSSDGVISSFAVTASNTTYSIAAGSTLTAGLQPFALAMDSSGTFLLDVNSLGGPYFASYTFDATTAGKLDVQIVSNTGASPQAIVAAP